MAATNRELEREVEAGRFRRDLYFRLNVFPISLPPLRARPEDIVPLVLQFLAGSREMTELCAVAADARHLLETYPWPGNVRELENEVARIVTHAESGSEITARMLSPRLRGGAPPLPEAETSKTLRDAVARFEAWYLGHAARAQPEPPHRDGSRARHHARVSVQEAQAVRDAVGASRFQ